MTRGKLKKHLNADQLCYDTPVRVGSLPRLALSTIGMM